MRHLCLFAWALPACFKEVHRPGCSELETTELADDETSPLGFTADDLLAIATPGWAGSAEDVTGSIVDAAVEIARGAGSAVYVHADPIDVVTRTSGFGDDYLLVAVSCPDAVEVPIDLAIASSAASIDLDLEATLRSPAMAREEGLYQAEAVASDPWDGSGATLPSDVDPSWEEQTIDALVEIQPDGQSAGSVKWVGTDAAGDSAEYADLLTWNVE